MYAYCFNNPVNMVDYTGSWPEWIEDVINWVDENVIQPVAEFVDDLVEDCNNYDIYNESEEIVYQANYFSCYKGAPVLKVLPGKEAASFGAIFLGTDYEYNDLGVNILKHEYGHCEQIRRIGVIPYTLGIAAPSVTGNILNRYEILPDKHYYNQPWEYIADMYGKPTWGHAAWADGLGRIYWGYLRIVSWVSGN